MKLRPILLLTALCMLLFCASSFAQKNSLPADKKYTIQLINGSFIPEKNIASDKLLNLTRQSLKTAGRSVFILQFDELPTEATRAELKTRGINVLEYISGNSYYVATDGALLMDVLKKAKARAVLQLQPEQKMHPKLANGIVPSWAVKTIGTVDIWFSFHRSFALETVLAALAEKNMDVITSEYQQYRIVAVRIATGRVRELAAMACVEFVQPAPKQDELLNNKSISNSRANILHSAQPGGRHLTGEGVVIGVGDDSNPMRHIDMQDRIINRSALPGGSHGVHVMGIVGGAGIRDERYMGYAPKSTIISQALSNLLVNTGSYVQDYGMVITNNSYGNITDDCEYFGVYDLYSRVMDQHAFQYPNLQHVFAAGNSGLYVCGDYLTGYGNVLGGYQAAKNAISVGNTDERNLIVVSSSRGPVRDGRIKPEIMAQGLRVASTWPTNIYSYGSGTSMAAPAVAGGLGLLYERYRQLHGNANPKNGLMKALVINGATDLGNPGPDFQYGFGWMNLLRSVKMLEQENYFNTSVQAGATSAHTITIPAGMAQMKVMLYWNDSAAAALAAHALVNDLDLEVSGPGGTFLPAILDTLPNRVNLPSTTGADHINNIEQVVINNPGAGTYTFNVKGTQLPMSNQHEYFLVFDTLSVSTTLTSPTAASIFNPVIPFT